MDNGARRIAGVVMSSSEGPVPSRHVDNGWRLVAGIVQNASGEPVPSCQIDVLPLTVDAEVLDIAVFSDNEGRWTHDLRADAEFRLIARTRPGSADGHVYIPKGLHDIGGVKIILNDP